MHNDVSLQYWSNNNFMKVMKQLYTICHYHCNTHNERGNTITIKCLVLRHHELLWSPRYEDGSICDSTSHKKQQGI